MLKNNLDGRYPWRGEVNEKVFAKFLIFDERFPELPGMLIRYAREARDAGKRKYAIRAVIARVLWDKLKTNKGKKPEWIPIPMTICSCYSRLLMHLYPTFAGFFETRVKAIKQEFDERLI